ncbi:MAG: hypothetical protein KBG28_02120 [Kofleriaceae bacterium]|nr:hypothetical protein [Kofleriaceae bacterium]
MSEPRSGELATRRLAAVLLDLHDVRATGRLLLRRGRISKTIDLADGDPVSASSTMRDETLGHFLVSQGVITDAMHREAVVLAAGRGGRVGAALVELGALTPERLLEMLTQQTRHKLVSALRWPQGAWRFDPSGAGAVDGIRLPAVDLVLTGLRDTASEVDDLRRLDGMAVELTARGRALLGSLYAVFGAGVIDAIVDEAELGRIERRLSDARTARATIDALLQAGLVEARVATIGLGQAGAAPVASGDGDHSLYELLFGEAPAPVVSDGSVPLELADREDSGQLAVGAMSEAMAFYDERLRARTDLLTEALRVAGAEDHYAVLLVGRKAEPAALAAALAERQAKFSREYYARFSLDSDGSKLDEVQAAYLRARDVLLDDARRRTYDRELAGGELSSTAPALSAEVAFRAAEDLMARAQWAEAIRVLEGALATSPTEPAYRAALGWAVWNAGDRTASAADQARVHLNAALASAPDGAAAHEYKARIALAIDTDEHEGLFHLERAVVLDPARLAALAELDRRLIGRGEARQLERLYRRLLHQVSGRAAAVEQTLWLGLARVYGDQLDDHPRAVQALSTGRRLAGAGAGAALAAYQAELEQRRAARRPTAGVAVSAARDRQYLAAAVDVATGIDDADGKSLHARTRPTHLPSVRAGLDAAAWALLRHRDDSVDLGSVVELLAPVIQRMAPLTMAELDLDGVGPVDESELPTTFVRVRRYVADALGVPIAPVYVRPELRRQVHVAAIDSPALLAGDEAVTAPERPELVFWLARAMTMLWPGRSLGASRPARVIKTAVLAVFHEASGTPTPPGLEHDALHAAARAGLAVLNFDARGQARAAVLRLFSRGHDLNLTQWSRGLLRSADRAGLLLCGDPAVALAAIRELDTPVADLADFAVSDAHLELRQRLGLAVEPPP